MTTKIAAMLAASAGLACNAFGVGDVVISAAYTGGGFAAAGALPASAYQNDFVELHNRTNAAVSINGWSLQQASVTGTTWNKLTLPNVSIPAGGYYLVRANDNAFSCGTCPPVPFNFAGGNLPGPGEFDMSASATGGGKVALMNTATTITSGIVNPITDVTFGP